MYRNASLLGPPLIPKSRPPYPHEQEALDDYQAALTFLDELQELVGLGPNFGINRRSTALLLILGRRRFRRGNVAGVLRMAKVFG